MLKYRLACEKHMPAYEKGRLAYKNGRPAYKNGRLAYKKGRLAYENGRLAYENGRLAYEKGRLAYKNHRPAFENSSRSFKKHQSKKSPKLMLQIHQCGMLVPKLIVCGFYRIYLGLAFMHFVIQIIHIMLIRHSLVYNLICISKQSYLTLYIKYTFSHPTFN